MNEREAALHYYEMMTGVFNDRRSKFTRYALFAVLLAGIAWGGYGLFRVMNISDTDTPMRNDSPRKTQAAPKKDSPLQKIIDLAQNVQTMKNAGSTLATAINGIHSMPFNLNPVAPDITEILPIIRNNEDEGGPREIELPPEPELPKIAPLRVRMIMTAADGQRIAVVDGGGEKAAVLRRGDRLPDDSGFVSAIRPGGITVIVDKQELNYDVPQIPMYQKIRGSKK